MYSAGYPPVGGCKITRAGVLECVGWRRRADDSVRRACTGLPSGSDISMSDAIGGEECLPCCSRM